MKVTYRATATNSQHVHVTVFIDGKNSGELVFTPQHWVVFSTAQLIAASHMASGGFKHYEVKLEDAIFTAWQKANQEG